MVDMGRPSEMLLAGLRWWREENINRIYQEHHLRSAASFGRAHDDDDQD